MGELAGVRGGSLEGDTDFPFQLLSRRLPSVYTWGGRDIEKLNGCRPYDPAFMNPDDLAALGLSKGDVIEIRSSRATILAEGWEGDEAQLVAIQEAGPKGAPGPKAAGGGPR